MFHQCYLLVFLVQLVFLDSVKCFTRYQMIAFDAIGSGEEDDDEQEHE